MLRGWTVVANRCSDTPGQLGRPQHRLGVAQLLQKGDDLGRQLVAAAGPALPGQQARQAALLKRPLGLIKRGPRKVERRGRGRDGLRLDFDAADHFVFDLDDVTQMKNWCVANTGSVTCSACRYSAPRRATLRPWDHERANGIGLACVK